MQRLKVMIADDEVTIIEGLKKLIPWEEKGYEVVCEATDGINAINLAKKFKPDLIIMDVNMPLCSGLEAIENLSEELENTVFIILSGYDDFEYARKALHLNVFEYLLKPVKINKLTNLISDLHVKLIKNKINDYDTSKSEPEKFDSTINQIVSYINMNISKNISLKQLACEFHMNASYLSQLFKNETGVNYHTYLNRQRINRAKKLLLSSDMSISEIATEVGFNDYRVFTKAFKHSEKTLPSSFRNNNRR